MVEQTVTLNPGESTLVTFEAIPHEAKTYHVSVDGLAGSFVAREAPPAEFAYVSAIRQTTYLTSEHGVTNELAVRVEIDIQNQGAGPGVCKNSGQTCIVYIHFVESVGMANIFTYEENKFTTG
ncbi:unnamed protein product [marine sediment metagenome]|uniref:Uncharacterized protein n=1 Tax=marine sediment metagenome TaxID=412755 RepID=X1S2B5_9ZZZZ